ATITPERPLEISNAPAPAMFAQTVSAARSASGEGRSPGSLSLLPMIARRYGRAISGDASRRSPHRPFSDVLLQSGQAVVARCPLIAHSGLLHDAPRADVLGNADRDDALEADRTEPAAQAGDRGFGAVSAVPGGPPVVIGELHLRSGPLDAHQPTLPDELAG